MNQYGICDIQNTLNYGFHSYNSGLSDGSSSHGSKDGDTKKLIEECSINQYGGCNIQNALLSRCRSNSTDPVQCDASGSHDSVSVDEDDSSSSSESSAEVQFSFWKLSRPHKGLLMSICLTDFLIMCCISLISPLLPPLANSRNITGQMQGWIMASFAGGQFIIFPVFGKYVTKIGSKFMYISGIFVAGGCFVLVGSLQYVPMEADSTIFITLCFVLQVVAAIGVSAEQTSSFAVASKEFSGCFTTVFGITEVFVGLGLTIGPLVGGVLSDFGGFSLPYFVLGGLVLLSLPFNYYLTPSIVDEPQVGKLRRKSGLYLLRHPSIIITCIAVIIGSGVWSVLDPILEPHLAGYHLASSLVGAVFLLLSASYAFSCALCGWIAEKLPDNRLLMIPGFLLCAVAHCLLGPTPLFGFDSSYSELWLVIVALILLGAAMSMAIIPSYDIIMEIAIESGYPDNLGTHGLVAGLWSSMYALGDFFGPVWGGYIQDNIGFQWGLTYTAGACLIIVVLLTIIALYDCYCCEVEEDKDDITEKSPLLGNESLTRSRSLSEPTIQGRHMTSMLESTHYFDISNSFSSNLTWSASLSSSGRYQYYTRTKSLLQNNDSDRNKFSRNLEHKQDHNNDSNDVCVNINGSDLNNAIRTKHKHDPEHHLMFNDSDLNNVSVNIEQDRSFEHQDVYSFSDSELITDHRSIHPLTHSINTNVVKNIKSELHDPGIDNRNTSQTILLPYSNTGSNHQQTRRVHYPSVSENHQLHDSGIDNRNTNRTILLPDSETCSNDHRTRSRRVHYPSVSENHQLLDSDGALTANKLTYLQIDDKEKKNESSTVYGAQSLPNPTPASQGIRNARQKSIDDTVHNKTKCPPSSHQECNSSADVNIDIITEPEVYRSPKIKVSRPKKPKQRHVSCGDATLQSNKGGQKSKHQMLINRHTGIRAPLFKTYMEAYDSGLIEPPNAAHRRFKRSHSSPMPSNSVSQTNTTLSKEMRTNTSPTDYYDNVFDTARAEMPSLPF